MPSEKGPVDQSPPDLEIVGDKVTIHPSGFTGGPEPQDDGITERNLVHHMARFRENPFDFLREVSLYMSGTGWRAYDDVIGQPIFYSGFSDRMKTNILASSLLRSKVKELAEARLSVEEKEGLLDVKPGPLPKKKAHRRNEIESNLKEVVDSMLDNMICKMESRRSYISELLGQPKRKENLADFLSSSSVLSLKLGRVDVRFHEPWSLREFVTQQLSRLPDQIGVNSGRKLNYEERGRILRTLGYRVLSEINDVSVMMPTALVGTVLLTLRGRGVGKAELVRRVEWLCERVRMKGGRVAHFYRYPTEVVVDRALEVLGSKLVGVVSGLAEPTYYAVDRFQLSFYRNMTIHLFITEALVSAAMYTKVKRGGGPSHQRISYTDLLNQVSFLSQVWYHWLFLSEITNTFQLFRGEFIFPPEGLTTNLEKTLLGLEKDNVITVSRDSSGTPLSVELSDAERQCGRENYDFYCFLIWPFIEASWLGSVSLLGLTPPVNEQKDIWIDLKKAQDSAQLLGKTLYHQGDLSYFEAVNKETLKNSYQRFAEEGIILVRKSKESRAAPVVKLAPEWTPERDPSTGQLLPRGRLWDFTELIAQSRREGKNRRDGATVSSRVLIMTDLVGRKLFESAASPDLEDSVDVSARQQRRKDITPSSKL
ncbi:hypothetical protein APSETT445_003313 [Aspergillus pseudonomiae]